MLGRSFRPGSRETVRGVNLIGTHFPRARARAEPSDAFRQQTDRGVNLIGTHFPRARARAEPSDAFRQQTDPLEPAGRRFANFFFDSSTKKRLSE